jgi:hypothetical protein
MEPRLASIKAEHSKIKDKIATIEQLVCSLNSGTQVSEDCACKTRIIQLRKMLRCYAHSYTQLQNQLDVKNQIVLEKQRKQAETDIDDILNL